MQRLKLKNIKGWIGIGLFIMLFGVIGTFSYEKMSFLLNGVEIKAEMNHDSNSSVVSIKGNAKNAILLTLNGREIFIEKDGTFTEPIALLPGFSVVTLNAEDKFGKTSEKKFEVMYEEGEGRVAIGNPNINTN
jgi:hypothetical protein